MESSKKKYFQVINNLSKEILNKPYNAKEIPIFLIDERERIINILSEKSLPTIRSYLSIIKKLLKSKIFQESNSRQESKDTIIFYQTFLDNFRKEYITPKNRESFKELKTIFINSAKGKEENINLIYMILAFYFVEKPNYKFGNIFRTLLIKNEVFINKLNLLSEEEQIEYLSTCNTIEITEEYAEVIITKPKKKQMSFKLKANLLRIIKAYMKNNKPEKYFLEISKGKIIPPNRYTTLVQNFYTINLGRSIGVKMIEQSI